MEAIEGARSATSGPKPENVGPDFHHFGVDELHSLMTVPPQTSSSSFTALLQLPANQAVELLVHSSVPIDTPIPVSGNFSGEAYVNHSVHLPPPSMLPPPIFPSDAALIDRAAKYSIFASSENSQGSSCSKKQAVKQEPLDSDSSPTSSDPKPSKKRKDKANKVIESNKKNKKTVNETSTDDDGKLPYVHVRARRGQATDSHSLAERARREKINARMKLLQELVPGCNKISGTASVLDEIINHVQTLQRQVEFLSMRLSTVNPAVDFNIENFLAVENGSGMNNIPSMVMPSLMWNNEGQMNMIRPQYQQIWETDEFNHPINNSLLSYNSPANSASLQSNQLKMEL